MTNEISIMIQSLSMRYTHFLSFDIVGKYQRRYLNRLMKCMVCRNDHVTKCYRISEKKNLIISPKRYRIFEKKRKTLVISPNKISDFCLKQQQSKRHRFNCGSNLHKKWCFNYIKWLH